MKQNPRKFTLADILWERDIWRHYYDGMDALRERRLDDAEPLFREAMRLNPNFPARTKASPLPPMKKGIRQKQGS